jgi:hypothetical protein
MLYFDVKNGGIIFMVGDCEIIEYENAFEVASLLFSCFTFKSVAFICHTAKICW